MDLGMTGPPAQWRTWWCLLSLSGAAFTEDKDLVCGEFESSLLQQSGPRMFKLSIINLIF